MDTLKLIDAHCHLETPEFDDCIDSIIDNAVKAGIVKTDHIICYIQ
jgi:hypothetical protein